jgi:Mg/Co/Ni transporter MgtE
VEEDKLDEFKKNYKDPEEFCCLFVVDGDFASFVYIPYPEDH